MIAFMIRFIRPGIIMERFFCIALSPSDTHCSAFIGFMGMVSIVRPSFASTGVSVNPGQHSHINAQGPEFDVKRFAEAVNKRFAAPSFAM